MNGQASQVVQYTPGPLIGLVGLEPQFLPHIFSSTDGEQHHESETVAAARPPPPPPAAPRRGPKPTGQTKPQQPVLVQNRRCSNCEGVEIRPSQAGATIRGATDTRDPSIVNEIPGQPNRTNRYPPTVAPKACNFCITNGEALEYSHSHNLREYGPEGQSVLTCPVLRRHICEFCGATGDWAHTRTHCPIIIANNGGVKPESVAKRLTLSSHMACGRRRRILKYKF